MIKNFISFLTLLLLFTSVHAQTDLERQQISSTYDKVANELLRLELEIQTELNQTQVENFLEANPFVAKSFVHDGNEVWLERIDKNGNPVYLTTYNRTGGITIGVDKLYAGGGLGLNLNGTGIVAGIWDGGYVFRNHREFGRRIALGETDKDVSFHGTHVGGTMVAAGTGDVNLRGMAPNGKLISYRFDNDVNEMQAEANNGLLVSNHSYGQEVTETTDLAVFGKYDISARNFDAIAYAAPYYLPVVSAGNDRNKDFNSRKIGYDLLTDRTIAKNVMTVGAVSEVLDYQQASDVEMSNFSSWGPTDDGRIKPDIVAKGVRVFSTADGSASDTAILQGTSMSSPMVSGGIMLLHQLYKERTSQFMKAATVKGLVLMTAKEAGSRQGPDYQFGWGLFDAAAAAQLILNVNQSSYLQEKTLNDAESFELSITTKSSERIVVALSWTDLPGELPSEDVDDPTPALVNDLDVKVVGSDGMEYFPYKLDPKNFRSSATTGVNNVDNVEIVHVDVPSGDYKIQVSHKGTLVNPQEYSLLVNGAAPAAASSSSQQIEGLTIFPNPAQNSFNISFNDTVVSNKVNVELYNTIGQRVLSTTYNNNGGFNERVDITGLSSGVYFVKVGDGTVSSTRKLIIR